MLDQITPLVPCAVRAAAASRGRFGAAPGPRFFVGLLLGLLWLGPSWWDIRFAAAMFAWDGLLILAWFLDWIRLPMPAEIEICRSWREPLSQGVETQVRIEVANRGRVPVALTLDDDVPSSFRSPLPRLEFNGSPSLAGSARAPAGLSYAVRPVERGDVQLGPATVRYRSALGLAERWAEADLRQVVRIYPNLHEARRHTLYLMRSRQIELEKRFKRQRGAGRDFESLREYRDGDELRDICWTATARRAKLVTRIYRVERSQQVVIVVDSGRLLLARTQPILGFGSILDALPAIAPERTPLPSSEGQAGSERRTRNPKSQIEPSRITLTKLDYAVTAALSLAQVALYSGDSVGLLAYGRKVRARLAAARGAAHLRAFLEQLAMVQGELVEADHARAASLLLSAQKRRSLIVWVTDLAETAATPEVIESASRLLRQHLVLFVAIGQPELGRLAAQRPATVEEMYRGMAAQEMVDRRQILLRDLRRQGALAVELLPGRLASGIVSRYLEIKERSLL